MWIKADREATQIREKLATAINRDDGGSMQRHIISFHTGVTILSFCGQSEFNRFPATTPAISTLQNVRKSSETNLSNWWKKAL